MMIKFVRVILATVCLVQLLALTLDANGSLHKKRNYTAISKRSWLKELLQKVKDHYPSWIEGYVIGFNEALADGNRVLELKTKLRKGGSG